MARYLLTGIAGFIASNIANHLLNEGHDVIGFDNLSTGFTSTIDFLKAHPKSENLTFIEGDIRDISECETCFEKQIDYVLHQAALGSVPRSVKEPLLYHDNNSGGTLNMMELSRQHNVKKFVYASSSSVYGDTPTLPKVETMPLTPKSPYAVSKAANETHGKLYTELYGLQTIGLRYFNVFGPRQNPKSQYAAVIPKFITSFLKNESPVIYGDGEQTRDFTYIQNVITANLNACEAPPEASGKAFNIGCGHRISINELASKIKSITASTAEIIYETARPGDVKDSLADIALSKSLLKLDTHILLNQGLEQTIAWYQHR